MLIATNFPTCHHISTTPDITITSVKSFLKSSRANYQCDDQDISNFLINKMQVNCQFFQIQSHINISNFIIWDGTNCRLEQCKLLTHVIDEYSQLVDTQIEDTPTSILLIMGRLYSITLKQTATEPDYCVATKVAN